jgi:hypothetical protein
MGKTRHTVYLTESVGDGDFQLMVRKPKGEFSLKKIAICAAALVAATIASQFAQAGGKGVPNLGVSGSSPGHVPPPGGSHGKFENAPSEMKHDNGAANAKELAPGD